MSRFFSAALPSLLLLADPSSSTNLRSIAEHDRRLSYELVARYEPKSQVTDHNAIDLDQLAMEDQLAIGTKDSFEKAEDIYQFGGHSKSVAQVKLSSGLPMSMDKGTPVSGQSADGNAVYGTLFDSYPNGADNIEIQYQTIDSQKNYVQCQVGGLPKPNVVGCFADSGTLSIEGSVVTYTYDQSKQNVNKRTLKKFSTEAEDKMFRCGENCPYRTFKKFREYYGFFDYADKWVDAAFDSGSTSFQNGNASFNRYGYKGKAQAIQKATAYMSVWMYVIREMEDALDSCKDDCKKTGCNDEQVRAWDEAVAFYAGSLEGPYGEGSGKLMHALADKRCKQFRTCGAIADNIVDGSHVNQEIIRFFTLGSRMIAQAKCTEARGYKERIENMMTVPLIQSVLFYASVKKEDVDEKAEAEGATFAAAILPIIHDCDDETAAVIYENMKTQKKGTSFADVKEAFESVYECMGVRGSDVGGLWDKKQGAYYPGAEPLSKKSGASSSVNIPLIIGCTAGGVVAGIIMYLFVSKCCCSSAAPVEVKEDPMSDDGGPSVVMKDEEVMPSVDSQCEPVEIS